MRKKSGGGSVSWKFILACNRLPKMLFFLDLSAREENRSQAGSKASILRGKSIATFFSDEIFEQDCNSRSSLEVHNRHLITETKGELLAV